MPRNVFSKAELYSLRTNDKAKRVFSVSCRKRYQSVSESGHNKHSTLCLCQRVILHKGQRKVWKAMKLLSTYNTCAKRIKKGEGEELAAANSAKTVTVRSWILHKRARPGLWCEHLTDSTLTTTASGSGEVHLSKRMSWQQGKEWSIHKGMWRMTEEPTWRQL